MAIDFSKNRDKDIEEITEKLFAKLQKQGLVAEEIGEQVGESFADGIEHGFEDAASRIVASSFKITKAFKDLAKKITNQSISLGDLSIDFSDIDINEANFQKKIDEIFEKFKIDNAIEFDSKDAEKQFKNMLGLHTKYATKLSKLREQSPRLTSSASIKANAQEQLAVIDGLKEIQKILDQTSGMSIELPHVYFGDVKELRTSISLIEQMEKGEEKVVKQRSASVEKIKKENKELKERNKLLEEKVGPIEGEEVPPAIKPQTKRPKEPSEADIARQRGEEMKTFASQWEGLEKEFGKDVEMFVTFTKLLDQVQKGALNAADAIAKLREEMASKAAEEAFNAELEAAVAAEVEEELKAEQEQLDLAKEELKVEKEITKEKEKQYGYHAGKFRDDGFKAENLWQSTPGRSTGFYGTGTYMTDNDHLKEITTGQYGKRPLNVIDPDMYNLFDATNDKTADQLHQFLKSITNKAFGGKGENIKSLYAEFKKLFPKEQIITYEDFKALVGELQQYVKDYGDKYPHNKTMDSVSTKFMKNFGYEGVDTRGTKHADTTYGTVIYDLKEESIVLKEITDEMQKQEIIAGNIASVIEAQAKAQEKSEKTRKNQFSGTINSKSGKFRFKKQDSQTYDTDSGQISMLPEVDAETDAKNKLSEANEKVAKSQKKVKEAAQGTQMTIDDIIPSNVDEAKIFEEVGKAAEKASKSKKKFAGANKEVKDSASPSVDALESEKEAIEGVNDAAKSSALLTSRRIAEISPESVDENIEAFNLPVRYIGENGQDVVQVFADLKSKIEEMTGKPVTIDFVSEVKDGHLEAVGATLKYVNEEAGITVKQFYDIERNENEVIVATQSHERATIAATKAAKAFNAEMQRKLALEQIKTLEGQMGSLELDLTEVKNAANSINDKASLEHFNLALRAAKEQAKQLKTELKGQNTLDTIASMERALLTLPSRLEELQRRLRALGDIEGVDAIDDVLHSINDEYQRFLSSNDSEEKVKLFRDLTSSMVWANSEMRNLSGRNSEDKKQKSTVKSAEDARKKAARESYIDWWKTTLNEQSAGENEVKARQKQEQAYSDWWNKALFEREQQEKAKDERVVAARKKQEEAYDAWWQKALYNKEKAPNLKYGKTTANAARRKLDATEGAVDALGVTNPKVLAKLETYRDKVKEVEDIREKFASDSSAAEDVALVKQFQKASFEAEQLRRGIKTITDEEQKMMQLSEEQGFLPVKLTTDQLANLKDTMTAHAKATAQGRVGIKGFNDDYTEMYYTVTNSKGVVEEMTMAIGQGTNTMYQYRTATKETGSLIQQIFKGIKVKAKELISFVIGGGGVYKVVEMLRQGIQYVREIDLALTELKKVTSATNEEYDRFLETAAKTGAKLGSTISAVTEATATFAKLGYTMEQATEMAESAIVYKNVGDNIASTEDAADSIISTMKGFKLEATEAMRIVDRFNEVGESIAHVI